MELKFSELGREIGRQIGTLGGGSREFRKS